MCDHEKENEMGECVKESITVKDKEVLVQLEKALVRLLQYCVHCSGLPE